MLIISVNVAQTKSFSVTQIILRYKDQKVKNINHSNTVKWLKVVRVSISHCMTFPVAKTAFKTSF